MDLLTVAALRLGIGAGVLLAGVALAGRLARVPRTRAVAGRVLVTGGLAAACQACYFFAVELTSVGVATFVALAATPVMVSGVTALRTRRGPDPRTRAAGVLALLAVPTGSAGLPAGGPGRLLVAYLGIGPTALAHLAFFAGLRTVPSTTASLLALLEPLTAAVGAFLLRDEALGPSGVLGARLLAAAVVVLRPRRVSPTMAAGLH